MRASVLLPCCAAIIGVAVLVLELAPGAGVSSDSVDYLFAAQSLRDGHGLCSVHGGPALVPYAHYPPLFPMLVAAVSAVTGLSGIAAACGINGCAWAVLLAFWSWVLARRSPGWVWPAVVIIGLLTSTELVRLHALVLTEPLFLCVTSIGLWAVAAYTEAPAKRLWYVGVVALALAALTRYVGIVGIATGALFLLLRGPGNAKRRWARAIALGVGATLPLVVWMWRNLRVSGNAADRSVAFHPMGKEDLLRSLSTIKSFVVQVPSPHMVSTIIGALVCMAVLGCVLWRWRAVRRAVAADAWLALLCLYAAAYILFLAISNTFFDRTPIDARILAPALVPLALVGLSHLGLALQRSRPRIRRVAALVGVGLLALHVNAFINHLRGREGPDGYLSHAWRGSEAVAQVRSARPGKIIYSNAVDAVWLHTGKLVHPVTELHTTAPPAGAWLVLFAAGGFYNGRSFNDGPAVYTGNDRTHWTVVQDDTFSRIYQQDPAL